MTKNIEKCIFCDTEGSVEVLTNDTSTIEPTPASRGYVVTGLTCYHCRACEEKWVDPEQDKLNHPLYVEARRKAEGLLSAKEIKAILAMTGYSDKEIAAAVGWGEVTLSRWKTSRECQSHANDAILVAIAEDTSLIEILAKRRGIILTGRQIGRPKQTKAVVAVKPAARPVAAARRNQAGRQVGSAVVGYKVAASATKRAKKPATAAKKIKK